MPNGHPTVVNLHLTNRCNYGCTYCFDPSGQDHRGKETSVFADTRVALRLMKEVMAAFWDPQDPAGFRYTASGGEGAMLPNFTEVVEGGRDLGALMSVVTNGLLLTRYPPNWIARNLDLVALSIDSPNVDTNLRIGRATPGMGGRTGRVFEPKLLYPKVEAVRIAAQELAAQDHAYRPTRFKVNTVLSEFNVDEYFGPVIAGIDPVYWKLFDALPVYTDAHLTYGERTASFLRRHDEFAHLIVHEDNATMARSYVAIDERSRFFWYPEVSGQGYTYSEPILEVGVRKAAEQANITLPGADTALARSSRLAEMFRRYQENPAYRNAQEPVDLGLPAEVPAELPIEFRAHLYDGKRGVAASVARAFELREHPRSQRPGGDVPEDVADEVIQELRTFVRDGITAMADANAATARRNPELARQARLIISAEVAGKDRER